MRLELAGRPRIVLGDGRCVWLEAHDAALLAKIALDAPVPRDRLCALVWPDGNRKTAQGNLRQRLFRMRRNWGLELAADGDALTLPPDVEHDLHPGTGPADSFLGDLRFDASEALADWVEALRERRRQQGSERLAAEAAGLEAEGRLAEAIALADRLVEREPLLEHAHRRAMRLHYRRGDRAAALQAYRRCRASLDRALGTSPSIETEALARLIEQSRPLPEASPAPPPVSLLRPPRLVGRGAAWAAWEAAWADGSVVVVSGEPGIGKTRFVDDYLAAHPTAQTAPERGAGDAARTMRAHPGDARMPYTAWARWLHDWRARFGPPGGDGIDAELARLVPGLGDGSGAAFATHRFRNACFAALEGWSNRGLAAVVIDDLQYADEATLETLLAWCAGTPRQRVAVAVRSTEMPALLVEWLGAQRGRGGVVEVALGALDPRASAELIESLGLPANEIVDRGRELARRTAGNPLFMIELLREARRPDGSFGDLSPGPGTARAPARIEGLLAGRLERLPPDALQLARVAGLAGADFSAELASAALGVPPIALVGAWAALERLQVFKDGVFAHDLLQQSAAASVPAALARTLHGTIATSLDRAKVAPARIAHHALAAGDLALAAARLEAAAVAAFAAVRHVEVVRFLDRARSCHEQLGDARAAFRIGCLAIDSALHVETEAAIDARTLALMEAATDDSEEIAAGIARVSHLGAVRRGGEAIPVAERTVQLSRRLGNDVAELEAAGKLGQALCAEGRPQDGIDLLQATATRFDAIGDSMAGSDFAAAYSNALAFAGRTAEAAPWIERCIAIGERLGRGRDLAAQWGTLAMIHWLLGRTDAGVTAGRRSVALHAQTSEAGGVTPVYAWLILANLLKRAGGWAEAERLLQQSRAAASIQLPALLPLCENHLATLYLELGQTARARQALVTPPMRPTTVLRRAVVVARLDVQAGRVDVEGLAALMTEHRFGAGAMVFDRLANQLALALASPAEIAIPICQALRAEAEALGLPAVAVAAAARLASASHGVGLAEEALQWARLARDESRSVAAFDMDAPELAWHLHQGLSNGPIDEALAVVRQALETVRASLDSVPAAYRDAYWHRSPFVPRLRALLARGA